MSLNTRDIDLSRYTRYYKYLVDSLSTQTPSERKSVEELLREDFPSILLRDGSRHSFSKRELEEFSKHIPDFLRSRIMLPLVLGKVHGVSVYVFSECDSVTQKLIEILVEERVIDRDLVEIETCSLKYSAVREILRRYGSLIILTIYQKSYIGINSVSDTSNEV
ncbi:MAG: DUF61 family protein [Sulfolobales archaeon]